MSSGTSFAAALVTGAVALYLQGRPQATVDDIRAAVMNRAREDGFTGTEGPLPNNDWGYGKLDAFAMVTSGLGVTPPGNVPETLVIGMPREGQVGEGNVQALYQFALSTPADIEVTVGSTYDAILAVYRTADVGALNPTNRIVAQDFTVNLESVLLRLGAESYTIVVTPLSAFTHGSHTVTVSERTISRKTGTIALGDTRVGRLAGEDSEDVYLLALEGQTDLQLELSPLFDGVLALHQGATVQDILPETEIERVDRSTSTETISVTVGLGSYLILVSPFEGAGNYTLAVSGNVLTTVASSDFDSDGDVDFRDFLTFSVGFGLSLGDNGYDPRLDLDGDRMVGFADFLLFASSFGQSVS